MSRPILKTLIFALCLTLGIGSALPASAADGATQDTVIPADYNKVDAVRAAVTAVEEQIPDFAAYYDMSFAPSEISGNTCGGNWRLPFFGGCGMSTRESLIYNISHFNGSFTGSIDDWFADDNLDLTTYDNKDLGEIVAIAKALPEYNTDAEFQIIVDDAEETYERGLASLRNNLPLVDPSLTNLETKTSSELVALYENLPIVKSDKYTELIWKYRYALVMLEVDKYNPEYNYEEMDRAYAELVAAAAAVDPTFKVVLVAPNETKPTPSAPDTGTNQDGETSATIVAVAVVGIASIAAISGATLIAKGYLFSPLKRRK